MNTVRRNLAVAVVAAAAAALTLIGSAGASSATPAQTVLWSQHTKIGAGGVDVTSPEVTIPAIVPGSQQTAWYFHYRWHCRPGVYATPVAYYTTTDGQSIPLVADRWAARDHSARYFPAAPSGTTVQIHWRMDIGETGQAIGSGGLCGHTFRITQGS